ncbi:ADP-ribosylglycohydrolase [Ruaniaceae bacterium KH17]|nr:ADP-ribosylglycohydrolase [Ruaniaceae bacterium KH17]
MDLTPAQLDRAIGAVVGSAVGDALGAGYEFTYPAEDLIPEMIGGGLGNFAPGEWTDDTAQAAAILRVAATGADLRTPAALDAIAQGFMDWFEGDPPDVGNQTRAVFNKLGPAPSAKEMSAAAKEIHDLTGRSAGNGALMRTGPVALAYLGDSAGLVEVARLVSQLTHYQREGWEAAAVWCLMIRHAVLKGEQPMFDDVAPWVPSPEYWRAVLEEAESKPPSAFTQNAWSVGALQAAWSAISHSRGLSERSESKPETKPSETEDSRGLGERREESERGATSEPTPFELTLHTAIRIGHDTDTVAAIAGALAGAVWGAAAVPERWLAPLHGWPGLNAEDLKDLTTRTVLFRRRSEG